MAKKKTTPQKQTADNVDLVKEATRLNASEKRRLMKAARTLVGKWSTSGDGMYYHIDKIMRILDDDVTNKFDSKVTFVVRSDECICMDSGMIAIDPGLKQKLNIELFATNESQLTTDEVMKMLDTNLASVIEGYHQACERHNHKPIKVKVGKKA
ncbi:hypothetical protein [Fibrobacter sp.]|uniref:hypothetical protein n=1 Tax=Fibrobacter sp. TaxID=35828 RepID=UPI00386A7861